MNNKKRKILISEIIIIAILALGILLPNLIGTTTGVVITENSISSEADVNGKIIAYIKDERLEKILREFYPDSKLIGVESKEEMADLLKSKEAVVLAVIQKNIEELLRENDEFVLLPVAKFFHSYDAYEDSFQYVLLKENCTFAVTSKTNQDVNMEGVKIGILMGSETIEILKKEYPKAEIMIYNTNSDVIEAVRSGKADYGVFYLTDTGYIYEQYNDLAIIPEILSTEPTSFVVSKNERGKVIYQELTQYIDEIRNNGIYDEIDEHWQNNIDNINYLDNYTFSGEKGTLKVVTCGTWNPKSFILNNEITGAFLEIIYDFCSKYGYIPDVTVAEYAAELSGISTGMYDVMADIASETKERSELVYFTQNVVCNTECFITKGNIDYLNNVSKASVFFTSIKESFDKTFIKEKRYEMILSGLMVTIELSLMSILFGTMLSCVICKMRMSENVFVTAFARIYIKLLQCTPIVVMLMIFYYIIFKDFSAFIVCVIGFTLDFSAYCSEQLRASIESVPTGQFRAAIALGFTKVKAFFKIVLPQALIRFIPLYSGQIIATIKLTSVAGYITVMDLTRVSDLVRSRTFEAFFPLVTTAIIYFGIASILIVLLKRVEKMVDPRFRKRKIN